MSNIYTLHYFEYNTRADACRALLAHSGVKWTDHRIKQEDWPALKASMPNGEIPTLELANGTRIGQASTVTRYLGA